jgi:hypothetical protein
MSFPILPDYDNGDADDDSIYSIISTSPDIDTATSPSELGHDDVIDDFDQFSLNDDGIGDGDGVNSVISCGCSTSMTPSAYEEEVAHGRRYHGFRRGRYPLPNDFLEQRREETNHALMLELTVCGLNPRGNHPRKWLLWCKHRSTIANHYAGWTTFLL